MDHRTILFAATLLLLGSTFAPTLQASEDATSGSGRAPGFTAPGSGGLSSFGIAAIDASATAFQVAKAMEGTPGIVRAASFLHAPTGGNYRGVSDSPLTTFPSVGNTFALLSSGDVTFAPNANTAGSTSAINGGATVNGDSAYDTVTLRVDVAPDLGVVADCLSLHYRFLSEEYPEFVGTSFNDAFIAEVGESTWTANNAVIASPNNFAFSDTSQLISINGAGGGGNMGASAASGTTYDGATPHYYAETPLPAPTLGADGLNHDFLYLIIFDQSDAIYDSTVFLDNLQLVFKTNCARAPSTVVHP